MTAKQSRTVVNPKLSWPFSRTKVKRVTRRQQQRDALKTYGRAPF